MKDTKKMSSVKEISKDLEYFLRRCRELGIFLQTLNSQNPFGEGQFSDYLETSIALYRCRIMDSGNRIKSRNGIIHSFHITKLNEDKVYVEIDLVKGTWSMQMVSW